MFLLNREEELISIISETTSHPVYEEELNGSDTFEFEVADIEIEKGYRLLFKDIYSDWREYIVAGVEEKHNRNGLRKKVYCESSFYETLGDWLEDLRPTNSTARVVLTQALSTTRWEVGAVDDLGLNSTNFYRMDAKTATEKVAEVWGGEIKTRIEVTGNKITGRFIDLYKNRGTDKGKRFTYTKDIEEVERSVSEDLIITALHGFGKGEEIGEGFGRRLDFSSINKGKTYLQNNEALSIFGRNNPDGTKSHIFGKVEFDDIEDKEVLKVETKKALDILSIPFTTYKVKVQDLSIFGYQHERVNLGDYVWIIDKEFVPELRFQARVVKIKRNLVNELETEITVGNIQDTYTAKSNSKDNVLNNIRDKIGVLDKVVDGSYQLPKAEGEGSLFFGQATPSNPHNGDIWFKKNGEHTETWQYIEGQWVLISSTADLDIIRNEVEQAQATADQAKLDAIKGREDAIAEADRLVKEQDAIYQEIFQGYDESVGELTTSIEEATEKTEQALEQAGVSADLAQTAKDLSEKAELKAGNALTKAGDAFTKATNAVSSVNAFSPMVTDAVNKSSDALTKANQIPETVDGIITEKGLVAGDWVDTRIDEATGEINYELSSVKGSVPSVVMGVEWGLTPNPQMERTDYVEDTVNLDDYTLQTAEFNVSVEGVKANLTAIDKKKLDSGIFTSFKTNEYAVDVNGIKQRLGSVETTKVDATEFQLFKENEYEITVDGFAGRIQSIESDKMDQVDFNNFKSNEYDLTVDGFNMALSRIDGEVPNVVMGVEWDGESNPLLNRTDYVEDSPTVKEYNEKNAEFQATIDGFGVSLNTIQTGKVDKGTFENFKTNDYGVTVDGITNSIQSMERNKLETGTFETFKTNEYEITVNGMTNRIEKVETDKLDTGDFTSFKSNEFKNTVDGINGAIQAVEGSKLGTDEFQSFKSNEYQVSVDGLSMELADISGAMPDYVFGVEWNTQANPQMIRKDSIADSPTSEEFEALLADYSFRADGWNATNTYIDNNKTQINSLISNASGWQQTITYVDANKTKFNETISQVDKYKQTIGTNAEKITQLVMTDSAFITTVSGLAEGKVSPVRTQVTQLAGSWALTLKSGTDIKTQINATLDGIRLQGKIIHLSGASLIDNATIKSAHIDTLNVSKLFGTTAEFTVLRSKVITANSITSEMLSVDTALINKLFATTALIDTLTTKLAFINSVKAIDIAADRITAGTFNAANVNLINVNASNIVTGTLRGANMGLNLLTGRQTFTDPITGNTLILHQGAIQFQKDNYNRYIEYQSEGITISPGSTNTGTTLNTSIHLNGGVSYLQFNNGAGTANYGRLEYQAGRTKILTNNVLEIMTVSGGIYQDVQANSFYTYDNSGNNNAVRLTGNRLEVQNTSTAKNIYIRPSGTGSLVVSDHAENAFYNLVCKTLVQKSSRKIKSNITPLPHGALEGVKSLQVVEYNLKQDLEVGMQDRKTGFIYEDNWLIADHANKGIDISKVAALTVKAVQELSSVSDKHGKMINGIDTKVTQHDLEIERLRKHIAELEEKVA